MSVVHFSTGDTKALTTGLSPRELRRLRWEDVKDATGIRRAAIFTDLERADVRAEVRLNPDALKRWKKGVTAIPCHLDESVGEIELTTDWQSIRAPLAALLWTRRYEDHTLGGEYQEDVQIPDGLGGKVWIQERRPWAKDLIEIRLPGDTALVVAGS